MYSLLLVEGVEVCGQTEQTIYYNTEVCDSIVLKLLDV